MWWFAGKTLRFKVALDKLQGLVTVRVLQPANAARSQGRGLRHLACPGDTRLLGDGWRNPYAPAPLSVRRAAALGELVLRGLSLLLLLPSWSYPNIHVFDYWVEHTMVAVVFSTVGAVRASRRPDCPVSWHFCMVGFVGGAHHLLLSPGEQRSRAIRRYKKILTCPSKYWYDNITSCDSRFGVSS